MVGRVRAKMTDSGIVLDGLIGALGGALITGAAQMWSYRLGKKDTRAALGSDAAQQLLPVVYSAIPVLRQLPHTDSPAGSPLSYGERLTTSEPMRAALRAADFTTVPILDDSRLRAEFRQFKRYCDLVSSPTVDASDIFTAVNETVTYAHHVGDCLNAYINGDPLPPAPVVSYPSQHVAPLPPPATRRAWRGLLPPDPA